ncbi:MAG: adenylate cyclase, partial [bacterium]
DTVVKLRPVVPADLSAETRKSGAFNVEVDVLPGGFVCSASFKGKSNGEEILRAVAGEMPLRKVFSGEQRAFYAEHAPAGIALDSLVALGPTFVLKATFGADIPPTRKAEERRVVTEMWLYPDGSRILELSTKCAPGEALQVAAATRAYLAARGIVLSGVQQTKTKAALEFFSAELAPQAATRSRSSSKRASSKAPARRRERA